MPSAPSNPPPAWDAGRPCGLWLGPCGGVELALAREAARGRMELVEHRTLDAAIAWEDRTGRRPALVLLAADRPGRWPPDAVAAAMRRWPLAALVAVVTSLGEGRRRSGPASAGIEEVAWHDLPGRLECWLVELAAGRAGALAVPATARREERLLDALDALAGLERAAPAAAVWVAAGRAGDLDGLVDLVALAGRAVAGRTSGRPPLGIEASLLLWDVVAIGPDDLAWLRMLAANRPGTGIVVLESFPRGDSVEAAVRAGAGAVLGRPLSLEALEGTLRRLEQAAPRSRPATGLGAAAMHR